jgi:hypothetical protein
MNKTLAGILLGVSLLLPAAASAIDGQVLINQSTVMAAGGFPYTITQPGSYKLSGNLIVPANTGGVVITADRVTLDLNGFSISGPLTCTGRPVTSCSGSTAGVGVFSNNQEITVKNGFVEGMATEGVLLDGNGSLVEEVHASQNGSGISVSDGIVRRCTADSNRGTGMIATGVLENNKAKGNGGDGIDGVHAVVRGNEAISNAGAGVGISSGTAVENSSSFNGTGIDVFSAVIGSNSLQFNGVDLNALAGATSQKNNNCTGSVC